MARKAEESITVLKEALRKKAVGRQTARKITTLAKSADSFLKQRAKKTTRKTVKSGQGIRPATLNILKTKRAYDLNRAIPRAQLAEMVREASPRGVKWNLGSMNMALAGLVKEGLVKKGTKHGSGFYITDEGKKYLKSMKRSA